MFGIVCEERNSKITRTPRPLPTAFLPFQGYHRYIKILLAYFCASPEVCHTVLMEFNHRWNISRAVENRGMAAEIGGFNHQYMIDHIQRATAEWYPD